MYIYIYIRALRVALAHDALCRARFDPQPQSLNQEHARKAAQGEAERALKEADSACRKGA